MKWTGAVSKREKDTWLEWDLVKAALILAEGHWTNKGNTFPIWSDERKEAFKKADDFRALFDELT